MTLDEIRAIAESRNIKPGKMSKKTLIKYIQSKEGNLRCYGTAYTRECGQGDCMWRDDCIDHLWQGGSLEAA